MPEEPLLRDLGKILQNFSLGEIFTDVDALESAILKNNMLVEVVHSANDSMVGPAPITELAAKKKPR